MEIKTIYEDNHLLVVEKPCNVGVQADSSGDRDVLALLKADLKARYHKPGNVFLALVHRLDRPVGGVLALVKTSKAAARLTARLKLGEVERTYLAVVQGRPVPRAGLLEHYLVKDEAENRVRVLDHNAPGSKFARLEYRELEHSSEKLSLVRVRLHTGRSHQIRAQFAAAGYPIWGDQKYAAAVPGRQIALWSYKLSFNHPTKKERMSFVCPPPDRAPWDAFPRHNYDLIKK